MVDNSQSRWSSNSNIKTQCIVEIGLLRYLVCSAPTSQKMSACWKIFVWRTTQVLFDLDQYGLNGSSHTKVKL